MSTPVPFARVKLLFEAAHELPPELRGQWLERECAGHPELQAEVEALLAATTEPSELLDRGLVVGGDALYDALSSTWAMGREIGPWRITRLLGHGGSGVVHVAERCGGEVRQQVALKLLRPGAETLDGMRRLLAEAQTLARLDHPGVARLIDGGSTPEGLPWIAMELVDGEPIDRACDQRLLPIPERLRLMVEVARTVGDLHREGLVHRDLKPGNLFLDRHGRPRVLDLGLARWLDAGSTATATHLRRLTPSCAAPEQIRGEAVSAATDVWALGVLLSRLLVDELPWPEVPSEAALLAAICEGPLLGPSRRLERGRLEELAALRSTTGAGLRAALTPALDRVVLACLERNPSRRYQNGHELAADLERVLAAEEPSAPLRLVAWDRRAVAQRARPVGVIVALLLLLLGWWNASRARMAVEERAYQLERVVEAGVAAGEPATCAAVAAALALGHELGVERCGDTAAPPREDPSR